MFDRTSDGSEATRADIMHRIGALLDDDRFHIAEPFGEEYKWTFANPAIAKLLFRMFFDSSSKVGIKDPNFINTLVNSEAIISICMCIHHALMCYISGTYSKDYPFGDNFTVGR